MPLRKVCPSPGPPGSSNKAEARSREAFIQAAGQAISAVSARDARGASSSTADTVLLWFNRFDDRCPTPSLRVRGQWLLRVADGCKSRIGKGFSVPCIAHNCRVLRAG
jgi:hypothetical protein